jgi:hypothetical protein
MSIDCSTSNKETPDGDDETSDDNDDETSSDDDNKTSNNNNEIEPPQIPPLQGDYAGSSNGDGVMPMQRQSHIYDASYQLHELPIIHSFPGLAGKIYGNENQKGEEGYRNKIAVSDTVYAPFTSKMEWEFAKWAKLQGPTSSAFTDLVQIEGVSHIFLVISFNSPEDYKLLSAWGSHFNHQWS